MIIQETVEDIILENLRDYVFRNKINEDGILVDCFIGGESCSKQLLGDSLMLARGVFPLVLRLLGRKSSTRNTGDILN
jgi:hypothetical protein